MKHRVESLTIDLDTLLDDPAIGPPVCASVASSTQPLVGEVIDDRHPTLTGRVLVRWDDPTGVVEQCWLPTLHALPVRNGDRVLITGAANFAEPIVTGVIDGFARRPEITRTTGAQLDLRRDETVRIAGADGRPLLELYETAQGPVVRLATPDLSIETPGRLRLTADEIELQARRGQIRAEAAEDVVVAGEVIHLN